MKVLFLQLFGLICWGLVTKGFDISRVHYVDHSVPSSPNGISNFLFRGNEPKNYSNQFAYDDLKTFMTIRAREEANIKLPQEFYLVDFNLENVIIEDGDISMEEAFFQQYSQLGTFINWPIVGSLVSPDDVPELLRIELVETIDDWSFDDLPDLMQTLRTLLYSNGTVPVVIYVHCEAGVDRTGEVSGSYYLKYLDWSFQQALLYDNHIENRTIVWESQNALQWYCYYLYYENTFPLNCTLA